MHTTKEIGLFGENAAAEYLEDKGYEILERNFRTNAGEIDIIALSPEEVYVFVEVKTRRNTNFGLACEAVDRKRQLRLMRAAQIYSAKGDMRFDIIEIYYSGEFKIDKINHIENAFGA